MLDYNYKSCVERIKNYRIKISETKSFRPDAEFYAEIKKCKEKYEIKPQPVKTKQLISEIPFLRKVKMYILAELDTIVRGQIGKHLYIKRQAACMDCHGRVESMEGKTDPGGIGFCSLCGCGASKRAALSVKLTIGGASCPLNKWESVRGTDWSYKAAIQAVWGIWSSAVYTLNKKIKEFIGNLVFRRAI